MKFNYRFILLAMFVVAMLFSATQIKAQSELIVEWEASDGTVATNALQAAIANDTDRPADRVYKLRKGGFYWLTETIQNNDWALRIVGEEPDPGDEYGNPAVLQMYTRSDASVSGKIIQGGGDVTLKNLYIVGADNNGVQTYYQPVEMTGNGYRYIFDNCVFERTNFAAIAVSGKNNDIFITNCKFRNLIGQPSTQQWEGRGISIWADQDTVVVENNTFFNIGMTAFQIEQGAANYVLFNHNTLVNVGRIINAGNWWKEAYFVNNLLVNSFWHGEGYADYNLIQNPTREARTSGHFSVGALPGKYGPEEGRRVFFGKTAAYLDPEFTAYYGDTIRVQPFINEITAARFIDKYDAMVVADTLKLDTRPGFPVYTNDIIPSMIQNIKDLRAGVTPATPWFWQLPGDPLVPSWPLPENFSYGNVQLFTYGTNNMPLGDLNWIPNKKAEWELIKEKDHADIKDLAGEVVILTVVDEKEAETGTISGGAEIKDLVGFAYYQMNGGFIEWKFNLETAGQYDINLWVNLNGRATSGINFFVNGREIWDTRGWGQYVLGIDESSVHPNFPATGFDWWLVKQSELSSNSPTDALTLPAGETTIQLKASWCDNGFAGFDLLQAGTTTVVKSLRAADVTSYDVAALRVEGAKWTPSALKSVAMGTNGSVLLSVTAPATGRYKAQLLFQNPGTTVKTAQVKVDGTAIADVSLDAQVDSTGDAVLSAEFNLTEGVHTIEVIGGNVNLDVVKLIRVESTVGIKPINLPEGYALSQNYPNPFNPTTTINFSIGKASNVKLNIYNILGQKVTTLVNNFMNAGAYSVQFNASRLASGVYFYTIEAGDFQLNKKMMLLK